MLLAIETYEVKTVLFVHLVNSQTVIPEGQKFMVEQQASQLLKLDGYQLFFLFSANVVFVLELSIEVLKTSMLCFVVVRTGFVVANRFSQPS